MADDKLLQAAKNNLDKLGDALGKQVGTAVTSSTNSTVDASSKLAAVKSSFATPVGTLKKIPEEVYKKIAEALNSAIPESIFTKYSTNEGKLIKQVATQIGKVLSSIDDQKVTIKENGKNVTYTIKFEGSHLGVKGSFINVSNGKNDSWLNWKNETSGKTVMAEYCAALYQLGKDVTNKVWKSIVNIFAKNAVSLFKEIYSVGGTDNGLKKILGNSLFKQISKDEIKSQVNSILSSSSNKKISTALAQYESLNTAYKNLETEINSTKSTVKTIQSKSTAFTTAAKKVQSSLKSLGVTVSLETLPAPSIGLTYDKNSTAVTVPAGYTSELKTSDYKSSVKTIYAGDFTKAVTINGNAKDNTIYCGTGNDKLYGLAGKDVLYGYSGKDTLYGGAGNDTLYGGANNDSLFGEADSDKLYGEAGDDTLVGGAGSDTLTGGTGKDVFHYSSGDGTDTITDYTAGDDKIKIGSGKIDKVTMSGTTVTFQIGSGSIKVQNVKDKEIIVVDASNKTSKYRNGKLVSGGGDDTDDSTKLTVTDSTKSPLTISSKVKIVNASARTKAIKITGNSLANTISGGSQNDSLYGGAGNDSLAGNAGNDKLYGETGNDTLVGGTGSDTLTGGVGKDVFYYSSGDGADTITDYTAGDDKIKIGSGKIDKVTMSGTTVTFQIGSGSIKVQNAKDKEITVVDASNKTSKYRNGKLVSDGGNTTIPSDAVTYNGHSYKLFNNGMTWEEANTYCKNLGGHLMTITDNNEQTFVNMSLLVKGTRNSYWLGGFKNSNGAWQWTTGETFSYRNWAPWEPNNHTGEENALMIYRNVNPMNPNQIGQWNDLNCDGTCNDETFFGINNFGFICEWENISIPDDALTYNGHRYYVYSGVADTWEVAQAYCIARGGHLAVINDNAENTALFNYMKSSGYDSAYFGLSDAAKEGTWTWVNGDSATYRNWASGEPNSENSKEDYAMFYWKFSDGKWNDGDFENNGTVGDTTAFICEWDSQSLTSSADKAEDYWFMNTMESNTVGDLDSLMREIAIPDSSVVSFSTDSVNDPNKLLNSITFAQVTKKK